MHKPIDAVVSWVDGNDTAYQAKLNSFCIQNNIDKDTSIEPTRIKHVNEIHYCLLSLDRFAPWVRTIYILTNQQIPPIVTELQGTRLGNKIQIIDQNKLLKEFNTTSPIFNSLSAEWLMWRIKGLSDHFIYLNDDFFIIRDLSSNDFFQENTLVLRGTWKTQAEKKILYQIKKNLLGICGWNAKLKTNPHRSWQEKSAQLAGWKKHFYLLPHAPFPLIKNTFDKFNSENPDFFTKNIRYPFRHPDQISSIPLMVHLDIKHERVSYDKKYKKIMVNGATHSFKKIQSRLNHAKNHKNIAFVCMQSIDQAAPEVQQYMLNWLDEQIRGC